MTTNYKLMKYNTVLCCYLVQTAQCLGVMRVLYNYTVCTVYCYCVLQYKQYSAWVSCGYFIIMTLCLPVLCYCIMPGTESCLYRHATRKSCTVQIQHRVRIA